MTTEFTARFGSLTVRYISEDEPLSPGKHFLPFLTDQQDAALTVRLRRPERLRQPRGTLLWGNAKERVYRDGTKEMHYYSITPPAAMDYICVCSDSASPATVSAELLREIPIHVQSILLSNLEMERLLHRQGQTVLHASWVMYGKKALLFSGDSGVGKTTQAELWNRVRGTRIINGDKTGIAFPKGRPTAIGMPFSGSSSYCENETAHICAIVMLSQAPENTIHRLSGAEAVRRLAGQMPCQRWCAEDVTAVFDYAQRIAEQVPVFDFACTKTEDAVDFLTHALAEGDKNGT